MKDLQLSNRFFEHQVSDRDYVDLVSSVSNDLQTVEARNNLAQAIINRLLTRKGELARLGHPNYGSRLYLLVGELNNLRLRGLAEIYIRECLAQEKRIKEIIDLSFAPLNRQLGRSELNISIRVLPKEGEAFSIDLPIIV